MILMINDKAIFIIISYLSIDIILIIPRSKYVKSNDVLDLLALIFFCMI